MFSSELDITIFLLGASACLALTLGIWLIWSQYGKAKEKVELIQEQAELQKTSIEDLRRRIAVAPLSDLVGADNERYNSGGTPPKKGG